MSCCLNDLGLKPHNQNIDLKIDAEQTGDYTYLLDFAGAKIPRKQTVTAGDDLIVPGPFNEDYIYTFTIQKPDGTNLLVEDCENFIFKTYLNLDTSMDCDECDDDQEAEQYS